MTLISRLEREENLLSDALHSGDISQQEFNEQMRELQREYREQARESAQEAYDAELERW